MTTPRLRLLTTTVVLALVGQAIGALTAGALPADQFAHSAFERTWNRTDKPVEDLRVSRTWVYGSLVSPGQSEEYADSPGGQRLVQYFDKARMEITYPDAVDDGLWYVTTGLLVVEMMDGRIQVGADDFRALAPARIPVAGDLDDADSPTYADLAPLRDAPPGALGAPITRFWQLGQVFDDPTLAVFGVYAAEQIIEPGINHQIASVFWDYMNAEGIVYEEGGFVTEPLFVNPFYATGYPITEAYWVNVDVGGTEHLVLLQCFERRCLTFTPQNQPGWQVEFGNVGLHYYTWRYAAIEGGDRLAVALLSGENAAPPVATDASGHAAFVLSDDSQRISYYLAVDDIEAVTSAHIHIGAAGETGEALITLFEADEEPFTGSGVLAEGTITAADLPFGITPEDLAELAATGMYYVNVHTMAHPDGEIRGQIVIADDLVFDAVLEPRQEVADPPVVSAASGHAALFYDNDSNSLEYSLTVDALEGATAAHIHLERAGQNGPVVAPLLTPVPGAPVGGTIVARTLTGPLAGQSLEQLIFNLLAGRGYINVHSAAYPAGEIRGQIALRSPHEHPVLFTADLRGDAAVPPVVTDAGGLAMLVWQRDGGMTGILAAHDLAGATAAHIHLAATDAAGPVVATLPIGAAPAGDEINGILAAGAITEGALTGPLAGRSLARLAYELLAGHAYANVHTSEYEAGAIRGQLRLRDDIRGLFLAELSGAAAIPPVTSPGSGVAIFISYREEGSNRLLIDWRLVVDGIEDMHMAHIHQGGPVDDGPVVAELITTPAGETIDADGLLGSGTITDADLLGPMAGLTVQSLHNAMAAGSAYVNIHSLSVPSGEIRGAVVTIWER